MNFLDISNAEEFMMWEISNSDVDDHDSLQPLANLVTDQLVAPERRHHVNAADVIDNWILKNIHWLKELSSRNSVITKCSAARIYFKLGPYVWRIYCTDQIFDEVYNKLLDKEDI